MPRSHQAGLHRPTHSHNGIHDIVEGHALDHCAKAQALQELRKVDAGLALWLDFAKDCVNFTSSEVLLICQLHIPADNSTVLCLEFAQM